MLRNPLSPLAGLLLVLVVVSGIPALAAASAEPGLILHNGAIVPMTSPDASFSAMLVRGSLIERLGTDEEILALADEGSTIIDLDGRAVYPGFIDPHTHLLGHAHMSDLSMAEAEQLALGYGLTHVADMHIASGDLQSLRAYANGHGLAIRVSMYLLYNDACGTVHGTWYERYPAGGEVAPRLTIGGVKVFSESSACGSRPLGISFTDDMRLRLSDRGRQKYGNTDPLFAAQAMADVFARIDRAGYQIAVHAIGDGGGAVTLNAFEILLDGAGNEKRHMLLHNWFVSDDLLDRYGELGIAASIEVVSPCYVRSTENLLLPDAHHTLFRYADLVGTGAHIAASSDWPWVGSPSLDPLYKLSILTRGESEVEDVFADGAPCDAIDPSKRVSIWQALRMMTVEAAYMLHVDEYTGTLEPGKWADLVVLSADPLRTPLSGLGDIDVQMTIIDGQIAWDRHP